MPVWAAFDKDKLSIGPSIAGSDGGMGEDFIKRGEEFMYEKHGFIATSVTLPAGHVPSRVTDPSHALRTARELHAPSTLHIAPLPLLGRRAK